MNAKNIVALVLVFSLAFALASCKKQQQAKESSFEKVSEVQVVDEEGETYTLATSVNEDTGETEYFYQDNSGNVVTVKAKEANKGKTEFYVVNDEGEEVSVETSVTERVVTVPRTRRSEALGEDATGQTVETVAPSNPYEGVSLTPEQESFIANFSNKNPEDYVDHNAEKAKLTLGNEALAGKVESQSSSSGGGMKDDKEGALSRNKGQAFFDDIKNKNTYTMKFVMRSSAGGQASSIPVTIARDGSKKYLEASAPINLSDKTDGSMTMKAYLNGSSARVYIPNIKAYIDVPADEFNQMIEEYDLIESKADESGYKGTYNSSLSGKAFIVDVYETDSVTTYYYYENNNLKRIESIDKNKDTNILEITEISYSADRSLFNEPSGYINISEVVGSDI